MATAEEEFSRPEYVNQCPVPILLEGYSVKKDSDGNSKKNDGDDDDAGLSRAPNFASSLLCLWCATKLGLASPRPQKKKNEEEESEEAQNNTQVNSDYVLSNMYAVLLPGEGTLLLGPSSSGKTTLMRSVQEAIGGEAGKKKMNIEGCLQMGNLDVLANSKICQEKNFRRATAFADQGDLSLTPVLTVQETIHFARRCAEGNQDFIDESILAILQMLELDHVKDTVVGNADIRGISGGQKRRVKILEMAVGKDVTAMLIDEPTNGLDSAGALVLAQVVGQCLRSTKTTALVSLLQPSMEVFEEFQRLILLTPDGKLVYSGKRENVLPYFENTLGLEMPSTMIVPEFLLRCIFAPHEFRASDTPQVPLNCSADWSKAFLESQAGKDLLEEIATIKTDMASQQIELPTLDNWAIPTSQQIKLLFDRSWKLVMRDPASFLRVAMALLFGLFIGTLFLNTSNDERGTFVRSGYVLTLLFITFLNSCMAPLEALFKDRNTFYVHRSGTLYRTASYYMSQVISSAPVPLLEAFFLSVGSFFLVGMTSHQGGWGFFYFWLQISLVGLNGNAVSRILAYLLPTEDMANTLGPAALLFFILTTGYSPRYLELPVWLRWLSWLSPCAYVYEGIIQNEVLGRDVGNVKGADYAAEMFQIPRIPYEDAPPGMNSPGALMAFDVYMVIAITIVFELMGCFLLHKSQARYGPTTKRFQVASGMSLEAPPKWITKSKTRDKKRDLPPGIPRAPKAQLAAKGIVYEVDVPVVEDKGADTKEKEEGKEDMEQPKEETKDGNALPSQEESRSVPITVGEYGQARRGELTEKLLKRRLGQDAINEDTALSSIQTSTTSIRVELPPAEPGRLRLLSSISASFEPGTMTALMGSSGAGKSTLLDVLAGYKTGGHISGEISINGTPKTDETWRSVAGYCEQVDLQNPSLTVQESLIFAARLRLRPFTIPDQDKVAFATNVLSLLELEEFADMLVGNESAGEGLPKHARKRLTVGVELCANPSILFADEPTSGLDSLSASVVVASLERAAKQEGLTIVCTIHQPSRSVFEAFDNLLLLRKGGICVYNGPIAAIDNYLCSAPNGERFAMPSGSNPADHFLNIFCGPGGEGVDWSELYEASDMVASVKQGHEVDAAKLGKIAADTTPQSFTSELYLEIQRELLVMWRTPQYMATRLWWTISASIIVGVMYIGAGRSGNVQNVIGSIFFYVNVSTVPLLGAMVPLIQARAVFYREISSGTYRRMVYGIAVQIAEIPFNLAFSVVSFICFYFLVGLSLDGERIAYFFLMSLAAYWMLPAFGQLLAFISPNLGTGVAYGSLLLTLFTLTMGFLIPADKIPPWYIWIYWLNPLRYVLQGMVSNEIGGTPEGDAFLSTLQWDYDDRWWYCFVAVLLFGIAFSVGILGATCISWLQR